MSTCTRSAIGALLAGLMLGCGQPSEHLAIDARASGADSGIGATGGGTATGGANHGCGGFGGGSEWFALFDPSPSSVDFGTLEVGTSSAPAAIKISGGGHAGSTIDISVVGTAAGAFVADVGTCTTPLGDAFASSCVSTVVFAPTTPGAFEATLEVTGASNQGVCVFLSGTGR